MCGIVGAFDSRRRGRAPPRDVFDRMVDALARRGPDGRGVHHDGHVALGHRRLAILDPTDAGAQPMRHKEKNVVVVYNGEIYNFRELKADLESRGHRFVTRCDTEVLLAAYVEWGVDCVSRFNGIFAFGLFDYDRRRLLLARDHLGIKPLFFGVEDGVVRFASEMKAILADASVDRRPDLGAILGELTLAYVPPPRSPFAGYRQVRPGHVVVVDDESDPVEHRYWTPHVEERPISFDDALELFREKLSAAVVAQMVSDVPLGAFLSGGLDSAAVVGEMVKATNHRVRTFSVGFTEKTFDERDAARETARILGTEHSDESIGLDVTAAVQSVAETNCDLLADASLLAVDALCKSARKHVTVALSGDGADEILAGYPTYPATYLARAWRRMPRPLRALARSAAERLPVTTERYNARDFALRFLRGAERGGGRDFAAWRVYVDDELGRSLLKPEAQKNDGEEALEKYADAFGAAPSGSTLLKRMLLADVSFYLPGDMLAKVDRASMRNSLEVRVPFLDKDLVETCLALPSRFLLSPFGEKKRILRRHIESRVSKATATRKKTGFNVPVGAAFAGPLGDLLLDAVRTRAFAADGPVSPPAVEKLLADHRSGRTDAGYPLYAVLVLALWWARFLRPIGK